ncbi:MAG: hypothetical protein AB2A00_04055 [Myxococcota bacterium]
MSAAEHEREAEQHARTAEQHAAQYDPTATAGSGECVTSSGRRLDVDEGICWSARQNPTSGHLRAAKEHRRIAEQHRMASQVLRDAEAQACAGIAPDDRDMSPFDNTEDIVSVAKLTETRLRGENPYEEVVGAVVVFRAVRGLTAEWLQRVVDCHLARNAALGHVAPDMPDCPLVPRGVEARVWSTGNGFAVGLRSDDPKVVREILDRTQRLRGRAVSTTSRGRRGPA